MLFFLNQRILKNTFPPPKKPLQSKELKQFPRTSSHYNSELAHCMPMISSFMSIVYCISPKEKKYRELLKKDI